MGKRLLSFLLVFLLALSVFDVPVYAAAKKYSITYELNGGTNNAKNPATYTTKQKVTFKSPKKKGYTFGGWYTDKTLKTRIKTINKGSKGKVKVYAKWTINKYNIAFDGNGATSGTMAGKSGLKYGKKYTLPANTFKRKGCTFIEWNTKPDGTGKAYKNQDVVKSLTTKNGATVTLYAQWLQKMSTDDFNIVPNDGKDDTAAINSALEYAIQIASASGGRVRVNLPAGVYNVTIQDFPTCAVFMRSNVELKLASGATIKVKSKAADHDSSVVGFFNVKNAVLSGGKIQAANVSSEHDIYAVWVKSSNNITISGTEIKGAQCDGIYLSPQQLGGGGSIGNSGITINKCKIHDNARSNISIVDADNVTIQSCKLYNPGFRSPSAGINIEPNPDISGDGICKNILIKGCTISTGRAGDDWTSKSFQTYNADPNHLVADKVKIEGSTLSGYFYNGNGNVIVSSDCVIDGSAYGLVIGQ